MSNDMPQRPGSRKLPPPKPGNKGGLPTRRPAPPPSSGKEQSTPSRPSAVPPPKKTTSPRPSGAPSPMSSRPRPSSRPAPRPKETYQEREEQQENYTPSTPNRPQQDNYEAPVESYEQADEREPTHIEESATPEDFSFSHNDDLEEDNRELLNEEHETDQEEVQARDPKAYAFAVDEDDDSYVPKAQKKSRSKRKPPKVSKDQERFVDSSKRRNVLMARGLVGGVLAILVIMGLYNVVFPPQIPSPKQVVSAVNQHNGVLGFPTGEGTTFVQEFATAYLNVIPGEDREAKMKKYVGEDRVGKFIPSVNSDTDRQTVTKGPYISSQVKEVDKSNATYTVAAQLNSARWVYLTIPVYADPKTKNITISGTPTFIAPPSLAKFQPEPDERSNDDKLASELNSDVTAFFKAWGESDMDAVSRLIAPDASDSVKSGLQNSLIFAQLNQLTMYEEDGDNPNIREGVAQVTWTSTPTKEEGNGVAYAQNYNITMEKLDDGRWYVKDVQGSVTADVGD